MIAIGLVIGLVMGLTGAGGALVAIPLFMQFQNMSLKEASVCSLIAVVVAALSNFYYQRKDAKLEIAGPLVMASVVGSFFSLPYKSLAPEAAIAGAIGLIATYSLYNVWRPVKKINSGLAEPSLWKSLVVGFFLGVLITFTGLGGGVLMLPVLIGVYRLEQNRAVATSLVVVGCSSFASFVIQILRGEKFMMGPDLLGLIVGILVTSYFLKFLMQKISIRRAEALRKAVFTMVVALSLAKIFQ